MNNQFNGLGTKVVINFIINIFFSYSAPRFPERVAPVQGGWEF